MDDELYHFGVKGMKWGVRQRSKDPTYKKAFDEAYAQQDMGL